MKSKKNSQRQTGGQGSSSGGGGRSDSSAGSGQVNIFKVKRIISFGTFNKLDQHKHIISKTCNKFWNI
jgi:hypothetical protein